MTTTVNKPPVCILTAGKGSRMGDFANKINKALLPLGNKAAISHIIDRFPKGTRFVVALGHLKEQVIDYLTLAHPDLDVTYVQVLNYGGPGSGPGTSLYACRGKLQEPFYYVASDTLFDVDLDHVPDTNWIGTGGRRSASVKYCNLQVIDQKVKNVLDKDMVIGENWTWHAFVGLIFVKDYGDFWSGLEHPNETAGEHQITGGIKKLIEGNRLAAVPGNWTDVGDFEQYTKAVKDTSNFDFSKTDEFLYIVNGRVIKFFTDPEIVKNRVRKAETYPTIFPTMIDSYSRNFYAYEYVNGHTLYEKCDESLFCSFLSWMKHEIWGPQLYHISLRKACEKFYRDKTMKRLADFNERYPGYRQPSTVNGEQVAPIEEELRLIPWERLFQGVPVFMHGDLHFDHVVYDGENFKILDWRQDFGGDVFTGDAYYDLAKLYGGFLLDYDYIKKGHLTYSNDKGEVAVGFARRVNSYKYQEVLKTHVEFWGLDWNKVQILTGLIFLNMSPLHQPPFGEALRALGNLVLTRVRVSGGL